MVPVDAALEAQMDRPCGGRGKYPRRRSETPFEGVEEDPEEGAEGGAGSAAGVSRRTAFYTAQENSYTPRDKEARVRILTPLETFTPTVLIVRMEQDIR
jgi:hypothetical protein